MSVVIDSATAESTDKDAYDAEFDAATEDIVNLDEQGDVKMCGWTDITPTSR